MINIDILNEKLPKKYEIIHSLKASSMESNEEVEFYEKTINSLVMKKGRNDYFFSIYKKNKGDFSNPQKNTIVSDFLNSIKSLKSLHDNTTMDDMLINIMEYSDYQFSKIIEAAKEKELITLMNVAINKDKFNKVEILLKKIPPYLALSNSEEIFNYLLGFKLKELHEYKTNPDNILINKEERKIITIFCNNMDEMLLKDFLKLSTSRFSAILDGIINSDTMYNKNVALSIQRENFKLAKKWKIELVNYLKSIEVSCEKGLLKNNLVDEMKNNKIKVRL